MKAKKLKTNNTKFEVVRNNQSNSITRLSDNRPECPSCGNKYLNYIIVSTGEWKCSAKACKKSFNYIDNFNTSAQ